MIHKNWWIPVVGVLVIVGAVAGWAAPFLFPKYSATGFYYTSKWSLADYKRFKSEFGLADVLASYLLEAAPKNPQAVELLLMRSRDARFWETAVNPLYPMTKRDAREILAEISKNNEAGLIMGLDLAIATRDPTVARAAVLLLGDYITQTLLLTSLQNWIASAQASSNADLLKTENQLLQARYSIDQTQRRVSDLRALQTKYPEAQRMDTRQVVSADGISARYLSPIAQVIALESSIAEAKEALRRIERRAKQLRIETKFFDAAADAARGTQRGWILLDSLTSIKQQIFVPLDLDDDAIKEVSNRFELDLKGFRDQFSIGFGFRSAVLEPTQSERSPLKFGAIGVVLGLLAGLLLLAASFWINWRRHELVEWERYFHKLTGVRTAGLESAAVKTPAL